MSLYVAFGILAFVALSGCVSTKPGATNSPTPLPTLISVSVPVSAQITDPNVPARAHIARGPLAADAIYPVTDYNANGENATRLRVLVNGKTAIDKLVNTGIPTLLRIVTLADRKTVVLLDTYSGGAHCCVGIAIADTTGEERAFTTHGFANVGYKLVPAADKSGYVFLTADDRWAYEFSSFAGSSFPIRILSYNDGALVDVTKQYPSAVSADQKQHWNEYLTDAKSGTAPDAALVAYLADAYQLGTEQAAWQRIKGAEPGRPEFYDKVSKLMSEMGYVPTPSPSPSASNAH